MAVSKKDRIKFIKDLIKNNHYSQVVKEMDVKFYKEERLEAKEIADKEERKLELAGIDSFTDDLKQHILNLKKLEAMYYRELEKLEPKKKKVAKKKVSK